MGPTDLFSTALALPWAIADGAWAEQKPELLGTLREHGTSLLVDTHGWRFRHEAAFDVGKLTAASWAPTSPLLPGDRTANAAFVQASLRAQDAGRELPKVHVIAKNRLTQYMGPASAYAAVLRSIDDDVRALLKANPSMFTFGKVDDGVVNIRDFQTAGVVSFARGCPFYAQKPGKLDVMGKRVRVDPDYLQNCVEAVQELVDRL